MTSFIPFVTMGLSMLIDETIKGAGLAYIAKVFLSKFSALATILTDKNKDNDGQLNSFLKTSVAQFPTELAEGILEHTKHNLPEAEAQELREISVRFGELYAKALSK
jgi:hypothetical protein